MLQIDKGTDVPLPFKKLTSLMFNQYLSYSQTLIHYMCPQNSQLFLYVKCVIDNIHVDVHYTVEKAQKKKVEVPLLTYF